MCSSAEGLSNPKPFYDVIGEAKNFNLMLNNKPCLPQDVLFHLADKETNN